ncbi:MAG: thioredoxin domain-containing protein [Natrialbaceae archaeon]|nr:thioredoxin domain-containing protein [Natrialbaceae archaeon]
MGDTDPWLGVAPTDATDRIIAFEDPSCGTCRRFHMETLPTLRRDIIGPTTSYVYRPFPIVAPWGRPASHAIHATWEQNHETTWDLIDHYYVEQGAFLTGDVITMTENFLEPTPVDEAAIVTAMEDEAYDAYIQETLQAGEDAGVAATPTFLLFSDGEYVTELTGVQDASVFASALES